jgi:hypothetical protein
MKVIVNIDCTPDEARRFFGLPNVQPMQEAILKDIESRMRQTLSAADPETLLKKWLPASLQGLEQLQSFFWSQMAAAQAHKTNKASKD